MVSDVFWIPLPLLVFLWVELSYAPPPGFQLDRDRNTSISSSRDSNKEKFCASKPPCAAAMSVSSHGGMADSARVCTVELLRCRAGSGADFSLWDSSPTWLSATNNSWGNTRWFWRPPAARVDAMSEGHVAQDEPTRNRRHIHVFSVVKPLVAAIQAFSANTNSHPSSLHVLPGAEGEWWRSSFEKVRRMSLLPDDPVCSGLELFFTSKPLRVLVMVVDSGVVLLSTLSGLEHRTQLGGHS